MFYQFDQVYTSLNTFRQVWTRFYIPGKQWYSTMLPILVVPFDRKTRPFSISWGCLQSTSIQLGGHEDHEPEDRHSMSSSPFRLNPSWKESKNYEKRQKELCNLEKIFFHQFSTFFVCHKISFKLGISPETIFAKKIWTCRDKSQKSLEKSHFCIQSLPKTGEKSQSAAALEMKHNNDKLRDLR